MYYTFPLLLLDFKSKLENFSPLQDYRWIFPGMYFTGQEIEERVMDHAEVLLWGESWGKVTIMLEMYKKI